MDGQVMLLNHNISHIYDTGRTHRTALSAVDRAVTTGCVYSVSPSLDLPEEGGGTKCTAEASWFNWRRNTSLELSGFDLRRLVATLLPP